MSGEMLTVRKVSRLPAIAPQTVGRLLELLLPPHKLWDAFLSCCYRPTNCGMVSRLPATAPQTVGLFPALLLPPHNLRDVFRSCCYCPTNCGMVYSPADSINLMLRFSPSYLVRFTADFLKTFWNTSSVNSIHSF